MTRVFANILIWLCLAGEIEGQTFGGRWTPPLMWLGTFLFKPLFGIVPWDVMVMVTLALAWQERGARARVPAVGKAVRLSFITLAVCWVWSLISGGSAHQTYYQLHHYVMGLFLALLVGATCQTTSHVRSLGKVVLWACLYRCFTCIFYYYTVVVDQVEKPPFLSDHFDSALFVVGWFVLITYTIEMRTLKSVLWLVLGSTPIIMAIVLNNRRLAWACAGAGFALVYLVLENSKAKKRLTRLMLYASPLLVAYVVVGWGNTSPMFKPVASISSMFGEKQDDSSKMRDIENHNLLVTLRTNPLLGYGWGREYIEQQVAHNIADIFPQYRYLPHNSLLGVVGFSGAIGLWGFGQLMAVAAFLNTKAYRASQSAVARAAALTSLVAILVYMLLAWGDLGFNSLMSNGLLAICVGLAERLPTLSGAWGKPAGQATGAPLVTR